MSFDWQNLVTLAIVAVAVAYLLRVVWAKLSRRPAAGCGACGDCPSASRGEPQVVSLSLSADRRSVSAQSVAASGRQRV